MGHRPVEEAVHGVDVHVDVLGGLGDEMDISLTRSPLRPVRNVVPIKTALVEEDGVKVLVLLQVAVGGRETARLRTSSCVERLPTKTQVVLLAAVRLVPKQDVSEMQKIILCRDIVNNSLELVLRGIALAILDDLQTHVWPKVVFFSSLRDDAL